MGQLLRFAWIQAQCCLFAVLFFLGVAAVRLVPLPVSPADALLVWSLGVTLVLWLVRGETGREVAVIAGFHLVGLALELYKVRQGSWSYPDTGLATVGGVPLYSGFMYAAVGSYICQAWRRFDLRITNYRARSTAVVAALIYLNFFTSHVTADVRVPLALALLFVTRRTWVHYTVGAHRYAMPLALSFVLIGFFLWVAENAATLLWAWQYPSQESVWTLHHAAKLGSWSLLVVVSIVLVAAVKAYEGRLYGSAGDEPARLTAGCASGGADGSGRRAPGVPAAPWTACGTVGGVRHGPAAPGCILRRGRSTFRRGPPGHSPGPDRGSRPGTSRTTAGRLPHDAARSTTGHRDRSHAHESEGRPAGAGPP